MNFISSIQGIFFSHFMPYLDPVQPQLLFEADKGIKTPLLPFADADLLSNISDSNEEDYQ